MSDDTTNPAGGDGPPETPTSPAGDHPPVEDDAPAVPPGLGLSGKFAHAEDAS